MTRPKTKLGDLLELVIDHRGKTPKKLGGDFTNHGVPVVSAIHIKNGQINWAERERFVSQPMFEKWMQVRLQTNDVLLTSEAPLGEVALVESDNPLVLSQRLFALRCRETVIDPKFLKHFLSSPLGQTLLNERASGSTVLGIKQSELLSIEIPMLPISQQVRVGSFLERIDSKIRLNQQQSSTLESIAQTIFKSWFIDFDPVHAKSRGEQPEGMDAEIVAFFPDSFQESEIGPIPTGWSISTIGESSKLVMGQSPPGESYNTSGDGLPFYQGRTDFGTRFPSARVYTTEGRRLAKAGDTLVSVRAPVGDLNQALKDCVLGRGVAAIRHKSDSEIYTYGLIKSLGPQLEYFNGEGTVFGAINRKDFESLQVVEPSNGLVEAFERALGPLNALTRNLHEENLTLANLRDSLLPRLISGELEIPEELLVD